MILRLSRIVAIAFGLAVLFALSHQVTVASGGEDSPGLSWALGVLSALFLASAIVSERIRGPEANLQKDALWGLAAGGIIVVISRLL